MLREVGEASLGIYYGEASAAVDAAGAFGGSIQASVPALCPRISDMKRLAHVPAK
jgi:hypothetical protein